MKKSGVRRGVLVYKGPDPAGKMEIPDKGPSGAGKTKIPGYSFGRNHLRQVFDWDHAPFGARLSPEFGLPVPDFSLRTRDLEVEAVRELGSHLLFICRIVADQALGWRRGVF